MLISFSSMAMCSQRIITIGITTLCFRAWHLHHFKFVDTNILMQNEKKKRIESENKTTCSKAVQHSVREIQHQTLVHGSYLRAD